MSESKASISDLTLLVKTFVDERDWSQFHSPRNLATALSVEAAELLEPFQWLASDGAIELKPETVRAVTTEIADVFAYLLLLADKLNIDLADALQEKMVSNNEKYPADLVRGNAKKYSEY